MNETNSISELLQEQHRETLEALDLEELALCQRLHELNQERKETLKKLT
jgi:hypothetical protein